MEFKVDDRMKEKIKLVAVSLGILLGFFLFFSLYISFYLADCGKCMPGTYDLSGSALASQTIAYQ